MELRLNIAGFHRWWCGKWRLGCRLRVLAAGGYESMHEDSIALALKDSLFAHAIEAGLVAID